MRLGVDLGGTKIEGIALADDGSERCRRRVPTPRDSYASITSAITQLVASIEDEVGQEGTIGVGHPGAISPATGLIKNANSVLLNGRPLDVDLADALARPARLANDADCFTLSEATDGSGAGAGTVFGVILGTGVGGGLAVGGELLVGPNAVTGEWGHNPFPMSAAELPGESCYCGRNGCVETWLSGPGMATEFEAVTGRRATAAEIAKLAEENDADGVAALDRYVDRLARALAVVINIVDPHVIVLGGGVSNIDALYELVPQRWGGYVFSDRVDTLLLKAFHGDSSGVRGAAWLWD